MYDKYFEHTDVYKIPFFSFNRPIKKRSINKKSILISFGTANDKSLKTIDIIKIIKRYNEFKIFLEPRFFEKFKNLKNIFMANYSDEMFEEVSVAIIRAGYSTILNCIKNNIYIFYLKSNNAEIIYNSKMIKKYLIGESFTKNKNLIINNYRFKDKNLNFEYNGERFLEKFL